MVILREQEDKGIALEFIASLLNRVARLYQIPNWGNSNAVLLAKWITERYSCETLGTIVECLETPPAHPERKQWRLTPDTIQEWFEIKLDEKAVKWEKEYQIEKLKQRVAESQQPTNLPNFAELFKGTWFEKAQKEEQERDYQDFKRQYLNGKQD